MPRIELHLVTFAYQRDTASAAPAIDALDLDIADREFRVVLGSSGSGKSTLLRLIAGLERPLSGEIQFDGRRMNEVAAADRDVGMMFQAPALFPHLTIRENLGLGLRLRRVAQSAVGKAVVAMARGLEIESLLDRRPGQLSGGEQQRVALGRALIRRPSILLLDEPLSNLDAPLRRQLGQELVRLHHESAITTLLITHDPREVPTPATRVTVLEAGRIIQSGTMDELKARPASPFVAGLWPVFP